MPNNDNWRYWVLGGTVATAIACFILIGFIDNPSSSSNVASESSPALPDFAAADLYGNMEEGGFDCSGPDRVQNVSIWECRRITGTTALSVTIRGASATRIFQIVAEISDGTSSIADRESDARAFLGFVATIPYGDAQPSQARSWVEREVGNASSIQFGSGRYRLLRSGDVMSLYIEAAH